MTGGPVFSTSIMAVRRIRSCRVPWMLSPPRYHSYLLLRAIDFALASILHGPIDETWRPPTATPLLPVIIGLCLPSAYRFPEDRPESSWCRDMCGRHEATWRSSASTPATGACPSFLPASRRLRPGTPISSILTTRCCSFLTAREHVSKYDIFVPGYTTPAQYREACQDVM